jgi:hypothetical protein
MVVDETNSYPQNKEGGDSKLRKVKVKMVNLMQLVASIKLGVNPTIILTTQIPRKAVCNKESSHINSKRERCNKSLKVRKNHRKVRKVMEGHKDKRKDSSSNPHIIQRIHTLVIRVSHKLMSQRHTQAQELNKQINRTLLVLNILIHNTQDHQEPDHRLSMELSHNHRTLTIHSTPRIYCLKGRKNRKKMEVFRVKPTNKMIAT